jgi:hypothetical protein
MQTGGIMRQITQADQTNDSLDIAEYILRSISSKGTREDIPDGRLFGPRSSSKDPLMQGIPKCLLESIIEFTYLKGRPPTVDEFIFGCGPSQPHPAWNAVNVANAQNKLLYHEWSLTDGTFTILGVSEFKGENYLRVREKAITFASSQQDEMRDLIVRNGEGLSAHDLNTILSTKDAFQDQLEELRTIQNGFFNPTPPLRLIKARKSA